MAKKHLAINPLNEIQANTGFFQLSNTEHRSSKHSRQARSCARTHTSTHKHTRARTTSRRKSQSPQTEPDGTRQRTHITSSGLQYLWFRAFLCAEMKWSASKERKKKKENHHTCHLLKPRSLTPKAWGFKERAPGHFHNNFHASREFKIYKTNINKPSRQGNLNHAVISDNLTICKRASGDRHSRGIL